MRLYWHKILRLPRLINHTNGKQSGSKIINIKFLHLPILLRLCSRIFGKMAPPLSIQNAYNLQVLNPHPLLWVGFLCKGGMWQKPLRIYLLSCFTGTLLNVLLSLWLINPLDSYLQQWGWTLRSVWRRWAPPLISHTCRIRIPICTTSHWENFRIRIPMHHQPLRKL